MVMIKLSNPPVPEWDGIMAFMPVVGTYEFALSNDDMLIYYWQLFENRTNNDEPYIEKYGSLKELEKDVYGLCSRQIKGKVTTKNFKDIYNSLDKEVFLNKINALIKEYGNLINTYTIAVCIKTDEPIKLLSFIKSEIPDIETWDNYK